MVPILLCRTRQIDIINNLGFTDKLQFPSSTLDSLVKNLNKDGFKYLSQEFDNNVLDLVKQEVLYLMRI